MKYFLLILINLMIIYNAEGKSMIDDKKKVANSAEEICPIKIGETIPSVYVKNLDGENVDLNGLTSGKKSVLIFYRGGWCPFCNMQLANLNQIKKQLVELGYQLIAISIDKP